MRIMQAAQHIHKNTADNMRAIAALHPRLVGLTEMCAGPDDDTSLSVARDILGAAGYEVYTGEDGGAHCHEVPVAFRAGRLYRVIGVNVIPLSPQIGSDGLGNDRHLTIVRYINRITGRKGAHAHTHWNAGLQGPHGNVLNDPRVVAAGKGSEIMETELRVLLNEGDLTVTGDFNWRLHDNDPKFHGWTHSPQAMFNRLGLTYVTSGLDWLAWSNRMFCLGSPTILQPGQDGDGADHPWIIGRILPRLLHHLKRRK